MGLDKLFLIILDQGLFDNLYLLWDFPLQSLSTSKYSTSLWHTLWFFLLSYTPIVIWLSYSGFLSFTAFFSFHLLLISKLASFSSQCCYYFNFFCPFLGIKEWGDTSKQITILSECDHLFFQPIWNATPLLSNLLQNLLSQANLFWDQETLIIKVLLRM